MEKERPDPQELLQKIQEDESKAAQGKLKIFLGAAAGVGKTYAMLKAASQLFQDGEDVVIGYVEPHSRAETIALMQTPIETIPLKQIEYKGATLKEVNIDAILARKPAIVIIDELAHSNAFGSRNSKRYQDVLELLHAGISVYSALNIQHIESLNDIVEQIVGTKVMETVPDQIIEMADEVVLIDLPPEELIERLMEGKIYPKDRIQTSLQNFFRKGNLTALRELALRKTAQKVDQQVLAYRQDQAIDEVWASDDKLLLVLESGYVSEKIVRSAKNAFDKGFSKWFVGYFDSVALESKSIHEKQRLLEIIALAQDLGATPIQLAGTDPAIAIAECVQEQNITTVMLAQYKLPLYYRLFGQSLVEQLGELLPNINLQLVTDEITADKYEYTKPKSQINYGKLIKKAIIFAWIFAVFGVIMHYLKTWLTVENIALLYILLTVVSNYSRGKISALLVALAATISFDVFVMPQRLIFSILDGQSLITFLTMTGVGMAFSIINGNLRYQVTRLSKQQQRYQLMDKVNEQLAAAMIEKQVVEIMAEYFTKMFNAKYVLLLPDAEEELHVCGSEQLPGFDATVSSWVFHNNQRAGLNTDTFAMSPLMYVSMMSGIRSRGVVVVKPLDERRFFFPDMQNAFDTFIRQVGLTLERIHFTQVAIETKIEIHKHLVDKK